MSSRSQHAVIPVLVLSNEARWLRIRAGAGVNFLIVKKGGIMNMVVLWVVCVCVRERE